MRVPQRPPRLPALCLQTFLLTGRCGSADHAMVKALDDQIGNLTAAIKAKEMWEDTLLWFASDNGALPWFACRPIGHGQAALRWHRARAGPLQAARSTAARTTTVRAAAICHGLISTATPDRPLRPQRCAGANTPSSRAGCSRPYTQRGRHTHIQLYPGTAAVAPSDR
jgi:hypothetical protein